MLNYLFPNLLVIKYYLQTQLLQNFVLLFLFLLTDQHMPLREHPDKYFLTEHNNISDYIQYFLELL